MKNIEIRKATIDDAISLALLGRLTYIQSHEIYFEDRNDVIKYCDREYSVHNIKKELNNPMSIIWIVLCDELPVAYAILKLNAYSDLLDTNNSCNLQKIYILNDFTAMKIGRQLQEIIIEEAKRLNFEELWLTTYHKNSRAVNFYMKNGFRKVGVGNFVVENKNYEQVVFAMTL